MIEITTNTMEETMALGQRVSQALQAGALISLRGPLGSGKTTLTKGLAQGLGIERVIKSPTYTIVKEYPIPSTQSYLYHIDAYRLEGSQEDTVDIDNFMNEGDVTVIEWAEFIEEFLPEDYLIIDLVPLDNDKRKITLSTSKQPSKYTPLLQGLSHREGEVI